VVERVAEALVAEVRDVEDDSQPLHLLEQFAAEQTVLRPRNTWSFMPSSRRRIRSCVQRRSRLKSRAL
jgi:hypothetical protein